MTLEGSLSAVFARNYWFCRIFQNLQDWRTWLVVHRFKRKNGQKVDELIEKTNCVKSLSTFGQFLAKSSPNFDNLLNLRVFTICHTRKYMYLNVFDISYEKMNWWIWHELRHMAPLSNFTWTSFATLHFILKYKIGNLIFVEPPCLAHLDDGLELHLGEALSEANKGLELPWSCRDLRPREAFSHELCFFARTRLISHLAFDRTDFLHAFRSRLIHFHNRLMIPFPNCFYRPNRKQPTYLSGTFSPD